MPCGRKYILGIDGNAIQFEIWEQEGGSIPTWLPFEESTATALYGQLRQDKEFIYNMNFAHGDRGVHIIWDDLENFSVHLRLTPREWSQFLYFVTLKCEEDLVIHNWKHEGF